MSGTVHLIDYGLGNLHSVRNALQRVGATVTLVDRGEALEGATRIVLPGVGAFADGMRGLRERGLVDALRDAVAAGSRLLGICLGAQLLMSESSEFGRHEGLGLLPGDVHLMGADQMRVPHVGWAPVRRSEGASWASTALEVLPEGAYAYFVHSYEMVPKDLRHALAFTSAGDRRIVAAVGDGAILGVQFHPEKSGDEGLRLLQRYIHD